MVFAQVIIQTYSKMHIHLATASLLVWLLHMLALVRRVSPAPEPSGRCATVKGRPASEIVNTEALQMPGFKQPIIGQISAHIQQPTGYVPLRGAKTLHWSHDGTLNAFFTLQYDCAYLEFSMQRTSIHSPMNVSLRVRAGPRFNRTIGPFVLFQGEAPGHAYKCESDQSVDLGEGRQLLLDYVHIEAFRDPDRSDYYQSEEFCDTGSYTILLISLLVLAVVLFVLDACYSNCIFYRLTTQCTRGCCCVLCYICGRSKSCCGCGNTNCVCCQFQQVKSKPDDE